MSELPEAKTESKSADDSQRVQKNPEVPRSRLLPGHLIAAAAALIIVASFLFTTETLPATVLCVFRAVTGAPCPGCGMTRAFCSISHGEFREAWQLNPFSFLVYGIVVLTAAAPLWTRRFPRTADLLLRSRGTTIAASVVIGVLIIFGVFRIVAALQEG